MNSSELLLVIGWSISSSLAHVGELKSRVGINPSKRALVVVC
jgi:hypothetical protein